MNDTERARAALGDLIDALPAEAQDRILERASRLIADTVREERARCVSACRHRADLWSGTLAARSSITAARDEARARANEARYLADVIELGEDPHGTPDA